MPKSGKKNGKSKSKKAERDAQETTEPQPPAPGRLISLDGTRGRDLDEAARRVVEMLEGKPGAGLSRFDSSNTFFELRMAKGKRGVAPPQTLVLLYASDLLFRLRWAKRFVGRGGRHRRLFGRWCWARNNFHLLATLQKKFS